jgi:vacuolar-type H+-ATPase subunit F/Vma7
MKIVFIGNPGLSYGYKLFGIECISVTSKEEFLKAIEKVLKMNDISIVLLDSDFSSLVKDYIRKLRMKVSIPFIIEVPGLKTIPEVYIKPISIRW